MGHIGILPLSLHVIVLYCVTHCRATWIILWCLQSHSFVIIEGRKLQTHKIDRTGAGKGTPALVLFSLSSQSSIERGSKLVLNMAQTKLNKRVFSALLSFVEGALFQRISLYTSPGVNSRNHGGRVCSHGSCGEEGQSGVTSGHWQALQEDVTLQPNKGLLMRAYTSHLSVQLFLHIGSTMKRGTVEACGRNFGYGCFLVAVPSLTFVFVLHEVRNVSWDSVWSAGV